MQYIVPFDFTPVTRTALDHAFSLSEIIPGEIELLHIISAEKEREKTQARFDEVLQSLPSGSSKSVRTKIRVGNIFEDIAKEAEEGNADLLVMGTHGAKGLQKILGSHALKVVTNSNTPFLITQEAKPKGVVKKIVLPVDLTAERLQVVNFAADMAKKLSAEVLLVCKHESDEWLAKKLRTNIGRARAILNDEGVASKVEELPGKKSFHLEVIDYGVSASADLFAIAHYETTILPQFEAFSQGMITNEPGIPVLVIRANEINTNSSKYSFLTV